MKCTVHYCPRSGERSLKKLKKRKAEHAVRLESIIDDIENWGWELSKKAEIIKELGKGIGEIREMGPGGHRPIFFWVDTDRGVRELWITDIPSKKDIIAKLRFNTIKKAAHDRRRDFLAGRGC